MPAPAVNKRVSTKGHTNPPSLRLSLVRPLVPQVEKVRPGLKGIVGFVAGGGLRTKFLTREETFPHNRADPGRIQEPKEIAGARDPPRVTNIIHLGLQVRMGGTD